MKHLVSALAALAVLRGPALAQDADRSPVTVHPGGVYARLSQVRYERVQSLAGQDAFGRVSGPDGRLEPAVMLSYRLVRGEAEGFHATLGTGLADPGGMLLLGASVDLRDVFFTAGAATAWVEEGTDPLDDEIFRGAGDRTLNASLARERKWGLFLGVSFGLFP